MTYLGSIELSWWIEIVTLFPFCIYYFGDFETSQDAEASVFEYLLDLRKERCKVLSVRVKQCQPTCLTITEDQLKPWHLELLPDVIDFIDIDFIDLEPTYKIAV